MFVNLVQFKLCFIIWNEVTSWCFSFPFLLLILYNLVVLANPSRSWCTSSSSVAGMELLVYNLLQFLLLFLHVYLIELCFKYHVLIKPFVGAHEWCCEIFIHHILYSDTCYIFTAWHFHISQLLLDAFELDMAEVRLHFELEFLFCIDQ